MTAINAFSFMSREGSENNDQLVIDVFKLLQLDLSAKFFSVCNRLSPASERKIRGSVFKRQHRLCSHNKSTKECIFINESLTKINQ